MKSRKELLQQALERVVERAPNKMDTDTPLEQTTCDLSRALLGKTPTKLRLSDGSDIIPITETILQQNGFEKAVITHSFDQAFQNVNVHLCKFLKENCNQNGFFLRAAFTEVAKSYSEQSDKGKGASEIEWSINDKNFKGKTTTFITNHSNTVTVIEYFEIYGMRNHQDMIPTPVFSDKLLEIGVASSTFEIDSNNSIKVKVNSFKVYQLDPLIKNALPSPADEDVIERYGCTAEQVRAEIALREAIDKNPTFKKEGEALITEVNQLVKDKKISNAQAAETFHVAATMINDPRHDTTKCLEQYKTLAVRNRVVVASLLALTAVGLLAACVALTVATCGAGLPVLALAVPIVVKIGIIGCAAFLGTGSAVVGAGFFARKKPLLTNLSNLMEKASKLQTQPQTL